MCHIWTGAWSLERNNSILKILESQDHKSASQEEQSVATIFIVTMFSQLWYLPVRGGRSASVSSSPSSVVGEASRMCGGRRGGSCETLE